MLNAIKSNKGQGTKPLRNSLGLPHWFIVTIRSNVELAIMANKRGLDFDQGAACAYIQSSKRAVQMFRFIS